MSDNEKRFGYYQTNWTSANQQANQHAAAAAQLQQARNMRQEVEQSRAMYMAAQQSVRQAMPVAAPEVAVEYVNGRLHQFVAKENGVTRYFVDKESRTEVADDLVSGKLVRIERERANRIGDECGKLATEKKELLVENAELRREVEQLRRKAARK